MINGGFGRSVGIRTRGLLDPNQARYQTSPHPDCQVIIDNKCHLVKSSSVINHVFPAVPPYIFLRGANMGYKIQYSPESNKRYPIRRCTNTLGRIAVLMLAALMLIFTVKYRAAIGRWLLPGDPDITADALRGLIADVREGSAGDAIAAFCREIIEHAAT